MQFFKSTRCDPQGDCLEVAYKTSSYSEGGHCLEAAYDGQVLVRDSKQVVNGEAPTLSFTPREWTSFLAKFAGRSGPGI